MKKNKKENNNTAQINALIEKNMPKIHVLRYGEGEKELIIKVYPALPFTKRMEMIREIIDGVFMGEKDSVNSYAPEFLTLLQKYTVIRFYTNLYLPGKLNDMWLVLNYTPIYKDVVEIVGKDEINDIFEAANKAIGTYRQYLTTKTDINSLMNKLGGVLSDIEGKLPPEDIEAITSKMKNMQSGASVQGLISDLLRDKDIKD